MEVLPHEVHCRLLAVAGQVAPAEGPQCRRHVHNGGPPVAVQEGVDVGLPGQTKVAFERLARARRHPLGECSVCAGGLVLFEG